MLSYRHGFHAGNHADVIKHAIYHFVLNYMGQKDKPYAIVDTHAGAGAYSLSSDFSQKNREFDTGIGKLWNADEANMPPLVREYVAAVKQFNHQDGFEDLTVYPGSPWFALEALPLEGKAFFHELHPADFELLRQFVRPNRYRKVIKDNGFVKSIGLLPPPSKRGVTIIDPPYELKEDYQNVVSYVKESHKRFATGVTLIWYPVVDRQRIDAMEAGLKRLGIRNIQLFELNVAPDSEEKGMTGSGMIVINPPWTLNAAVSDALPYLVQQLCPKTGWTRAETLVAE